MVYDVCIIGGGASGMSAAIIAAKEGASVLVIERLAQPGKKLLATGNGKCNLTHDDIDRTHDFSAHYRSQHLDVVKSILQCFDYHDTLDFFETMALFTTNKNGYIYPASEQAKSVVDAMKWQMAQLKIDILTEQEVSQIRPGHPFAVVTENTSIRANQIILATGGKSNSVLGSNGSGYQLAKKLGHSIVPTVPALCGLHCRERFFKELAGIRLQGTIELYIDGKPVATDTGEIQLTNYGISGIPVFQISRFAAYALKQHKQVTAVLDLMPGLNQPSLLDRLSNQIKAHPTWTMEMLLSGQFNKKLGHCLCRECHLSNDLPAKKITTAQLQQLTMLMKYFKVTIVDTNSFEQSQVTAGGVRLDEIDIQTLASKKVPGLFIVGELLDVDGICGGYNLQWAWATGYIAGKYAGRRKNVKGKSN